LPTDRKEHVSIGWLGAALLTGGVSVLLIWVSFAGKTVYHAWISRESALCVTAGVLLLVATVWVSPALNPDHPAPDTGSKSSPMVARSVGPKGHLRTVEAVLRGAGTQMADRGLHVLDTVTACPAGAHAASPRCARCFRMRRSTATSVGPAPTRRP
jgi:hypothetical protein